MRRRLVRAIKTVLKTAWFARRVSVPLSPRHLSIVWRVSRICIRHKFRPDEAFRLGLFHPSFPSEGHERYVSFKRLSRLQQTLNPKDWVPLTSNKSLFYTHAAAAGLPVPMHMATVFPDGTGAASNGAWLATADQWARFIDQDLPDEFVVKRVLGMIGRGFHVFARRDGQFVEARGARYDARGLYGWLRTQAGDNGVLLQQRIRGHPDLARLSDTSFLQTARMITLTDREGIGRLIFAYLKLIVGDNVIDNCVAGRHGNIEASLDMETGRLITGIAFVQDGRPPQPVPAHPRTGLPIAGFQIPWWPEACQLARRAAEAFRPLRTIGWDIAITPDGPCIIEGNAWWASANEQGCMPRLYQMLQEAVADRESGMPV
jgi:hypothetical protein